MSEPQSERRETKLSAPWLPVPVCKAPAHVCGLERKLPTLAPGFTCGGAPMDSRLIISGVLLVLFSFPVKRETF